MPIHNPTVLIPPKSDVLPGTIEVLKAGLAFLSGTGDAPHPTEIFSSPVSATAPSTGVCTPFRLLRLQGISLIIDILVLQRFNTFGQGRSISRSFSFAVTRCGPWVEAGLLVSPGFIWITAIPASCIATSGIFPYFLSSNTLPAMPLGHEIAPDKFPTRLPCRHHRPPAQTPPP